MTDDKAIAGEPGKKRNTGWTGPGSPFHAREQELQERFGVREKIEMVGRKIIREYMPDQHQEFYADLGVLYMGWTDDKGRPQASVLSGAPGFLSSPDSRTLRVGTLPHAGDPFLDALAKGLRVGLLGLAYHNRRRNRLNGRVSKLFDGGFEISVDQAFGNCPKYIRKRLPGRHRDGTTKPEERAAAAELLGDQERALITASETFFIATSVPDDFAGSANDTAGGADLSHRGGKPGFVMIENKRSLLFPDFRGNFHFSTLGNIIATGRAGLLFPDFRTGDTLNLTGTAEVVWSVPVEHAYAGAERYVRFTPESGQWLFGAHPRDWSDEDPSPFLAKTGDWPQ